MKIGVNTKSNFMKGSQINKKQLKFSTENSDLLDESIKELDLDKFKSSFQDRFINYKAIIKIKKSFDNISEDLAYEWGLELIEDDDHNCMVVSGLLLERSKIWFRDLPKTCSIINALADSEDWKIRQISIDFMIAIILNKIGDYQSFYSSYIQSDNLYFRRIAISAAKNISITRSLSKETKSEILHLVTPLLAEKDPYVMTVSYEAFKDGFARSCPEVTKTWLNGLIDKIEDPYSKATILSIVSTPLDKENNLTYSLDVIERYITESDPIVVKARSSALYELCKKDALQLSNWLESKMHINQIVDHWADLEADGLIDALY
ncbi:MAG: DNA alkylation repair protein [Candidatus Heimdallarchaeota archaeon]|nr:DNA alkylation repair protein [Candidatus Heimdallarchaeota archaeon]